MIIYNIVTRWSIAIISVCVMILSILATAIIYHDENEKDWSKLSMKNIPLIFLFATIGVAFFSSIIGIFLCICQIYEMYITYFIIMIIIIIFEFVGVIICFFGKDIIIKEIEKNWGNEEYKNSRIEVEKSYKCCGFKNIYQEVDCGYISEDNQTELCFNKIIEEIKDNMISLKISIFAITAIELIELICALYLVFCDDPKNSVENDINKQT